MSLPSYHPTEIPEEGLTVACEISPDELSLTSDEAQIVGLLSVSLTIFMTGTRIDVNGILQGIFRRQCVRCLREYKEAHEIPFSAEFACEPPTKRQGKALEENARKISGRDEELQEFAANDEVYRCLGDRLELGEMLREHIILATPLQPLCRADCCGLCPHCGQDLNERTCGCTEQNRKNPFAVLRSVQAKSEQENETAVKKRSNTA